MKISPIANLACAAVLLALPARTATLTLDPVGGSISGLPGQTIGWGFTLTSNATDWISVTSSALTFETNPSLGIYTDFIGLQSGPSPSFAVAPGASWTEVFDGISQGIGSYALDPGAIPFSQNTGQLMVFFDIFNGDPTNGGIQTGSDFVSAAFSITVDAPAPSVPEPATLGLTFLALAVFAADRAKRPVGLLGARRAFRL